MTKQKFAFNTLGIGLICLTFSATVFEGGLFCVSQFSKLPHSLTCLHLCTKSVCVCKQPGFCKL